MRIDITMLEEDRNINTMLASLLEDVVEVRSTSDELVKMGKANQNKSYNVNKLTPPTLPKTKEIPPISSNAPPPVYHPLSLKQKEKILEAKKLDEVMMGRARLENKEFGDEKKSRLIENGLPKKLRDPGCDEDGNQKYGPMAPLFLDIKDEMERALAMEAYFNHFKNIIVFKKLIGFLGALPVQLKSTDWGSEVHRVYKRTEGDGAWHLNFKSGEFFSTMYFERGVDKTNIMKEKYIWFRLCGEEHVLTLPKFAVLPSLYEPSDMKHRLFDIHFNNLEIMTMGFDHNEYWKKIREPKRTNKRTSLVKDPLMRIVHKILVGALVHRTESGERCQKPDLWTMSMLEEGQFSNVAWIIAEYLGKKSRE
nr:hypothetical protein [Tanacetum cinerariifolium]